jgi:hypothetical protein
MKEHLKNNPAHKLTEHQKHTLTQTHKNEFPTSPDGGRKSSQDHRITTQPPTVCQTPCRTPTPPPSRTTTGRQNLQEPQGKRVAMYPSYVHTDITAMVPRCTTADLDLQDALDSPTKETWILNHHKLCCLAVVTKQQATNWLPPAR